MLKKITNVFSEKQSGGITSGVSNINKDIIMNTYIWKGRKEGFFCALGVGVIVEIIIRLIYRI